MLKKISGLLLASLVMGQDLVAGAEAHEVKSSRIQQLSKITRPVSLPFESWERALSESKHAHYFLGMESIDFSLVEMFRKAISQDPAHILSSEKTAFQRHAVGIFRKFAPDVAVPEGVSPLDIFYACLIKAETFCLGQQSNLEKHIFDHLEGNQDYRDLKMAAAQGELWPFHGSVSGLANKFFLGKGLLEPNGERKKEDFFEEAETTTIRSLYVNSDFLDIFQEKVGRKYLPHVVNAGELGLAFLIRSFIQDVAPIGLTHEPARVHGMPMTPGALAWHDRFHGHVSGDSRKFEPWVDQVLNRASLQSLSVQEFAKQVGPLLTRQYESVLGIYEYLYQQTTVFLMQGNEDAYKKMLVGFFLALHEFPEFDSAMYKTSNVDKILCLHLKNVRDAVNGGFSMSIDPLNTDFGTGKTTLTEAEIFKNSVPKIINRLKQDHMSHVFEEWNTEKRAMECSETKAKKYLNENLDEVKIRTTPYGTDLDITLKNGKRFVVSHPSNKTIFATNEDYGKLLNFLGFEIAHPVLGDSPEENKAVVGAYYKVLKKELGAVLDFFETTAVGMMSPGILSTGTTSPSFASDYFRKSWDNHAKIEAIFNAMKQEKEAADVAAEKPFWHLS